MSTITTDEGIEWISEKTIGNREGEELFEVAVGDGTTTPSGSDTALANELYRSSHDSSNCTVDTTSNIGEVLGKITITGGQEVTAGASISEIGLFVNDSADTLVYREVRDTAVTLDSGDRKTFEFTLQFQD